MTAASSRRWYALALICAAQFMIVLDVSIVNVALPSIKTALDFSQANLQWVVSAYTLLFGGFLLLGGRVADLVGRRLIFMSGLGLFTVGSLLCGLSWSEGSLIVLRGVQGLGAALAAPAALSLIAVIFEDGPERNKALGIFGAITGSGAAFGVLLGGFLTSGLGWEWIFFVNVPIGVAAIAITPLLVPESRADLGHRRYDIPGAVSGTAGLVVLVYAIVKAGENGWSSGTTITLLVASAALLASFVVIEMKSRAPIMPLRIWTLRNVAGANVVGFLTGASFFAMFFVLTLYMQQVLGYSAREAGVAYLAVALSVIIAAAAAGRLVTVLGVKTVVAVGLAIASVGLIFFTQVSAGGNYWSDLFPGFIVAGVGLGLSFVPVTIAALAGVEDRDAGLASGLINTSQQIGGALGTAICSTVAASLAADKLAARVPPPVALTEGFQRAFVVCTGFALAGLVVGLLVITHVRVPDALPEPETA